MNYMKALCLAVLGLAFCLALLQQTEAGKLKKLAKLAILGKALAPKIIPLPLPIHLSGGKSYHHDPWAGYGGGHGGGFGGGYGGGFGGGFGGGYGGGGGGWW